MLSLAETLEPRWRALWDRLGARNDPKPMFDQLVWLYFEPHRRYHTLDHIRDCLRELDGVPGDAALLWVEKDVVEVAIWFHDAICVPGHPYSEEYSAVFAGHAIDQLQLRDGVKAVGLIKATRSCILASTHRDDVEAYDETTKQFLDIDLAILGRPEAEFDAYEEGIRFEYQRVPDDQFCAGRIAVLEGFLARKRIYRTEHFHRKYEAQARLNLQRSIAIRREQYLRFYR
jgi:predicted metal-dependent HD superfamily phosphohydrolase